MVDYEIRVLCSWKKVDVMGWTVQTDHVHLVASIPPKLSVSQFMGSLKGKLAIKLFKRYPKLRQKPYRGNHFWARGFFVNTSGLIEEMIRRYFRYQEDREREEERNRNNFDLSS